MAKEINETFFTRPWAVKEDTLHVMTGIIQRHMRGEKLSQDKILSLIGGEPKAAPSYEVINGIAQIPIYGVIAKRINLIRQISQSGTSTEEAKSDIRKALADDKVEKILLDIDSPGGSVDGLAEFVDFIYEARKVKPVLAYANGMMASAAYWIGSAAEKVYVSKGSVVGSIGVYAVFEDLSVMDHMAGIRTEVVKAGKFKAAGNSYRQMTPEERDVLQEEIDTFYNLFVEAIARNRNMSMEAATNLADGRVWIGQQAIDVGLADEIADLDILLGIQAPLPKAITPNSTRKAESVNIETNKTTTNLTKEESMEITVELLKKEHSVVADALIAEGKVIGLKEGKEVGIKEGKESGIIEGKKSGEGAARVAEQTRVNEILAAMPPKMETIALQVIKDGVTVAAAKDLFLKEMKGAAPASPGANADTETDTNALTPEAKFAAEFKASAALQSEFGTEASYIRYKKAEAAGTIKILGKK